MLCDNAEGFGPWSPRTLDFTACFEEFVIESVPRVLLLLCGLYTVFRNRSRFVVPTGWKYYTKIGLSIVMSISSITAIVTKMQWIGLVINAVIFAFAAVLFHIEHFHSKVSSSFLLVFWLFELLITAVEFRTNWETNHDVKTLVYLGFKMCLSFLVFVLECIPKPAALYASLDEPEHVSPEELSNIFSRLTFHWMTPLMKLGYKKVLVMDDLWNLRPADQTVYNNEQFEFFMDKELQRKSPSLTRALFLAYWKTLLSSFVFKLCQDILQFTQPQLLHLMMAFAATYALEWSGEPMPMYKGIVIAFGMLFTAMAQTMFLHQYFHGCFMMGMRIRSSIVQAIYKKSLRLSNSARQGSTIGEITNLMAVDASKLADLCTYLHILWSGPMQICIAVYFLYQTLGVAVFGGIAVMVLMIPVNGWIAKKSRDLNKIQMGNKDTRTKMMDEVLSGMKVIKLYAWEQPFIQSILGVREKELSTLKRIAYLQALSSFTWSCTPFLVSFTTFALYSWISPEPLTSTKVFVSLSLFNLLGFPLSAFPSVIASVVEASVSISRLLKFFLNEEKDDDAVEYVVPVHGAPITNRITIQGGSFGWDHSEGARVTLEDINLEIKDKECFAVVGSVGAGKSTLLSAILGDTYKLAGNVSVCGSIAYIPQSPWIMNTTVRENILFGKPFDRQFYEKTLEACGLIQDLECLIAGDATEIGERGINLSGGQKQRVAIARAVYSRADIYLFDDALSAVDAHVGRHIFDQVLGPKGLLKEKTRVLVTHGIHYLQDTSRVLLLAQGKVVEHGTFKELMDKKEMLFSLVKEYGKRKNQSSDTIDDPPAPCAPTEKQKDLIKSVTQDVIKDPAVKTNIITSEDSAKGHVEWAVYRAYAEACGMYTVIAFIIIAIIAQCFSVSQNVLLSWWAQENDRNVQMMVVFEKKSVIYWLVAYGILGLSYSSFVVFQVLFAWVFCGIRSARTLHVNLLENVLRLPQSFFDTTPLGRIMNRFSKDVYTTDEVLPRSFLGYFRTMFIVISVLAVNTIGNPYYMILAVPLGSIYWYCQKFYLSTSRELKRLDSTSRSPIYSNFQETLNGVTTIRAFGQQSRFIQLNANRVDNNQRAYYPSVSSNRWLAVRLEFIGSLIVFGSATAGVLAIYFDKNMSSSVIGLMLVYALSVTQTLNWMVRQSCEIETNIVSVERIKEYTEVKQEAPAEIPQTKPPSTWPSQGAITFKNYAARYRPELDLVIKNLDIHIKPKEKIGLVGRTGSGKSTLTLSLFRIIEPANGTIFIDGVDVCKIGLFDLRSALSIIPQDPILFNGTVRQNLDPFNTCTDTDIWDALEKVSLKPYISSFAEGLEHVVLQNGENFSVGQRQLICLARALVRKTKILILDEATAAIDVETDSVIQKTIRTDMKDCTVLTIAHRINTVMDSDRILVLDRGLVVEFDSPKALLKNKSGVFYSLAKEAGQTK